MKVIVTTSNKYHHLLPVFCFLFNKYWSKYQQVEIVGYDASSIMLPANFSFHSMGEQGDVKEWSTDLRKYFGQQDDRFIWLMEDTFIKAPVNHFLYGALQAYSEDENVGRVNLTIETLKQLHRPYENGLLCNMYLNLQTAKYRLSTQPSIWNKKFLLQYLTDGLTPWEFETQASTNDGWKVLGPDQNAVFHNEGVRRHNIHALNLDGIDPEVIEEMKTLNIL